MLTVEQAAQAILDVSKNARTDWEWTTEELEKDMEDYFFEQWEAEYLAEVM